MRNTKKGFTLVELIVVITILSILGTIAFVSLGSYTADARNAKRLDGISKIATSIDNDQLSGKSLLAYVTANAANNATTVNVGGVALTAGSKYQAGDLNATALNVKADQFKDPQSEDSFKVGVSTLGATSGVYEVATRLEEGSAKKAAVRGNYDPRTDAAKTTTAGTSSVELSSVSDINFFVVGDTTDNGVITAISPDGLTLTVDGTPATSIKLSLAETAGLISASSITGSADGIVTNNSTTIFPY